MEILVGLLWIVLGLVLLVKGADYLVDGASKGAIKLGISELLVGLTVIAFGTSAPELFVSVQATLEGQGGIALGNVVGSNICNLTLILGFGVVMAKQEKPLIIKGVALNRDFIAVIVSSALLVYFMINSPGIEPKEGYILLIFLVMYVFFLFQHGEGKDSEDFLNEVPNEEDAKKASWGMISLMVIGGLVALAVGSNRLVFGAVEVARALNVSETVIGLSVVALGTSLPELAATITAVKKGKSDMVVGNILGSNLFNVVSVVGISSLFGKMDSTGIHFQNDLIPMMALSVLVFLKVLPKPHELPRSFGILLLIAYGAYAYIRFFSPTS